LLPYSSFTDGQGVVLTSVEAGDISDIEIEGEAGYSSFGITPLQAYN